MICKEKGLVFLETAMVPVPNPLPLLILYPDPIRPPDNGPPDNDPPAGQRVH